MKEQGIDSHRLLTIKAREALKRRPKDRYYVIVFKDGKQLAELRSWAYKRIEKSMKRFSAGYSKELISFSKIKEIG